MKLLNRTLWGFLIYAVAVLLIVTPVLYFVISDVIIRQVDETLQVHKKEIRSRLEKLPSETAVQQWEDLDGEVVVEPLVGPMLKDSIYTSDEATSRRDVGKGRRKQHDHRPENEVYRVLRSSVLIKGKPYKLEARISLVESEDLMRTLSITQFVILLVLLSGMLLINWWNSKKIWSPFYKTLEALKSFQIERSKAIGFQPSKITEFNDLNVAIDELTRRVHSAFIAQREFTENAAHEMQTPLAVFQSKVELLLQTRPSEEQAPLIESLLDATSRLNGLNKALLLLARIDNGQFPDTEPLDLAIVTERLKGEHNISVNVESHETISFNRSLLEILLSNLISNSVRHSAPGSPIIINLGKGFWEIRNEGPPLSIPPESIFERFSKGTSNQASLGLGLAIAKKICDLNKVSLSYFYENGYHVFRIRFPEFTSRNSTKFHP